MGKASGTGKKPSLQVGLQPLHHRPIRKFVTAVTGWVSPEGLTLSVRALHTDTHGSASTQGPQARGDRGVEAPGNFRPPSRFKELSVHWGADGKKRAPGPRSSVYRVWNALISAKFLGKIRTQQNYNKDKPQAQVALSPLCLGPWCLQFQTTGSAAGELSSLLSQSPPLLWTL